MIIVLLNYFLLDLRFLLDNLRNMHHLRHNLRTIPVSLIVIVGLSVAWIISWHVESRRSVEFFQLRDSELWRWSLIALLLLLWLRSLLVFILNCFRKLTVHLSQSVVDKTDEVLSNVLHSHFRLRTRYILLWMMLNILRKRWSSWSIVSSSSK